MASISLRRSHVLALAVPLFALFGGVMVGLASSTTASGGRLAQALLLGLLAAVSCLWLWTDAREQQYHLRTSHFLGFLLAPPVAVPLYFNQTRDRAQRLKANAWFVAITLSTFALLWLGAAIVG